METNSVQPRTPVIHIGMPKTATKTLQWRIFSNHSEIYYLGRFDGSYFNGKYRQFECCRDKTVNDLMSQIAYGDVYNPDFGECRKLLNKIIEPALEKNLIPIWSWESYSTDILAKRRIRARNLKQVFDDARIIMAIRTPITLLESAYFLLLRGDNVGPRGKRGFGPRYKSIGDWLDANAGLTVQNHLEYVDTIKAYTKHFGIDNVSILLFEELKSDSERFFRNVCDIIGIDSEEGLQLVSGQQDNVRWTMKQVEALKEISESWTKSLSFRFSSKRDRKKSLGLNIDGTPIVAAPKARAPISLTWQKRIIEATREGNLWLQEHFGLPLEKYGYFDTKEEV